MVPSRRRVNAFDHDVMAITVLDTLPVSGAVPRDGISELQASKQDTPWQGIEIGSTCPRSRGEGCGPFH